MQKNAYPKFATSVALLGKLVNRGVETENPRQEIFRILKLDNQHGKQKVFGGGFLISKRIQRLIEEAEKTVCKSK